MCRWTVFCLERKKWNYVSNMPVLLNSYVTVLSKNSTDRTSSCLSYRKQKRFVEWVIVFDRRDMSFGPIARRENIQMHQILCYKSQASEHQEVFLMVNILHYKIFRNAALLIKRDKHFWKYCHWLYGSFLLWVGAFHRGIFL